MAKIIPFQGTCYNRALFPNMNSLFAPPYDVVSIEERDRFAGQSPYNIFHLELPSASDCQPPVKDKYDCAARLMKNWFREKALVRDNKPCLYTYDIQFEADGAGFTRKGLVCLLRTEDWSSGTVLPHERTFEQVTVDRLKLRLATRAQFSQIFMLYRHQNDLDEILKTAPRQELFQVRDAQGSIHRLKRISGTTDIRDICRSFQGKPVYIADGHHRYTTAIKYRKEMAARCGADPDAPYNYTMVYLVDVKDPGMIVLPTHRLVNMLPDMSCQDVLEKLSRYFHLEELEKPSEAQGHSHAEAFRKRLSESCSNGITLMFGRGKRAFVLCPKEDARKMLLQAAGHRELAELDVVVLEELVFKQALGLDPERLQAGKDIFYTADSEGAVRSLREHQMLFFMHPTPVEQVLNVADAGLSMPHKSTYFYPKILTGMVLNVEEQM